MTKGKRKRRYKEKKRNKKRSRGNNVPFTLANSPLKYKGLKNKHAYKTNILVCQH